MNLETVEVKAFVPARDMDLSLRLYRGLGFSVPWSSDDLATCMPATAASCCRNSTWPNTPEIS